MWKALTVAALAALVATTASRVAAGEQPGTAENGHALFVKYCATCHGESGRGNGSAAERLRVKPADLSQFARRNGGVFPLAKTRRIIDGRDVGAHGTFEMPVWGDAFIKGEGISEEASRARIEAIVRYLESIQERSGH